MESLDSLVHPQAWATALALADLSIAWIISTAAVVGLLRERSRNRKAEPSATPSVDRRHRFA
jgi:hypothetical protein